MNCLLEIKIKWSLDINTGAVERSEAARARRLAGATVVQRWDQLLWWPRRAFPPSASTARACRARACRARACRPPATRPSHARRAPAPVARLPRACRPACRAPVVRLSPALPRARRAPVARQARDKVLTDIRPSI